MTIALAIVDMQKGMFHTPDRAAKLPGLIDGVNRALAAADELGWSVFEIRTEWPNDPDAWSLRAQRANENPLQAGSPSVEIVDGVRFPARREVVIKTRHSAFLWTNLEARLRRKSITRLYIGGCWLDGCVGQTAIDAYERNIDAAILADAVPALTARGVILSDAGRTSLAYPWPMPSGGPR